jgi:altronate hydrolase
LYEKKKHWIDFNAGSMLQGSSINELTMQLMELILQVASGKVQALNETHGYRGISMLKGGATL